MTVFIASLFTPYTIHFSGHSSTTSSTPPASSESKPFVLTLPQQSQVDTDEPAPSQHARSQSLTHTPTFTQHFSTRSTGIPKTPGATTDLEQIFLPRDSKRPLSLVLPAKGRAGNRSTTSLHTLAAIDSQAAGWGKTVDLKQPKSRAKSPPDASILGRENSCPPEKEENVQSTKHARFTPCALRTPPKEKEFLYENYTVMPSVIGNLGLISAINAVSESGSLPEKTWVGTLGMPTDALSQSLKDEIAGTLENEHESLCVFVNDSDLNGHYEHYCKTILWPIFHYQIPDRPKSKAYQDRSWIYYLKVNEAFADRIVNNYKRGDIVWIHDYHLLLVPSLARAKLPDAQIGFFLHSAFPSSEVFRVLPMRQQLIEGMLGADMIGFQTDEYVDHFLQTCNRMLNVETTKNGLILESGRSVNVFTFPMGIDVPSMELRRDLQEVKDWIEIIGERYEGKKIMVARDKLDNVHGVREKMLAYEYFLKAHPEWTDHVVLIQIAVATTEDQDLNTAMSNVITRINSTYSTLVHQPIVFLQQDIDYSQYLALLTVAECLLVTGLREGMNLTSHEFVVCQDEKHNPKPHSPIILSEFTGAASVLGSGATLVNPWHYRKVSDAINEALVMDSTERKKRWEAMHAQIRIHDAETWYSSFMSSLTKAWTEHTTQDPSAVPRLSINRLRHQYLDTDRRLLLIDYEGTLTSASTVNDTLKATPKRVFDILNELIDDEKNMLYIMSQKPASELELTFQQVPGLGLIAENGSFLRLADTDEWINVVSMEHVKHWKGGVKTIMHYYEERIDGSEIEELESALVFRYPKATDLEYAVRQASECAHQINEVCCVQHVSAIPIEHGFFVSDAEVNKASAAKTILDNLPPADLPQFVLAIGDSREDEHVFHWAHELDEKGVNHISTVNVGQRNTEAKATLAQGITGVLSTLEKLARVI